MTKIKILKIKKTSRQSLHTFSFCDAQVDVSDLRSRRMSGGRHGAVTVGRGQPRPTKGTEADKAFARALAAAHADDAYVLVPELQHMTSKAGATGSTTTGMWGGVNKSEFFDGVLASQEGQKHTFVWMKLNAETPWRLLQNRAYYPHNLPEL